MTEKAPDWLGLAGRSVLVSGVKNRRSVAFHIGRQLTEAGCEVIYSVRTEARRDELQKRLAPSPIYVCDVTKDDELERLGASLESHAPLAGVVHSIAYGDYTEEPKPFRETSRQQFLGAVDVSCYSLIALSRAVEGRLADDASVVAISISSTQLAAENYGFMAPAKAALDSTIVFLAKSFSDKTRVRFNGVAASPLKTASSAGIPGYLESYLYAEAATLRKEGVRTDEVASTAVFLLSPRSAGVNATSVVVDAGMGKNFFDREIVERVNREAVR